jgi:hypothetical protein
MMDINYEAIEYFLSLNNLDAHIRILLLDYVERCKNSDALYNLLDVISLSTKVEIGKRDDEVTRKWHATQEMIQLYMDKRKKLKPENYVSDLIHVAMEHFPDGTSERQCKSAKEFFQTFVDCLKETKDKFIDSRWAKDIIPCNDYLKMVLEKNP